MIKGTKVDQKCNFFFVKMIQFGFKIVKRTRPWCAKIHTVESLKNNATSSLCQQQIKSSASKLRFEN